MQENQNVNQLRIAYQLWNDTRGGSVEHWIDLMSDDIKMGSLGNGSTGMEFTKPIVGKAQAIEYFENLRANWEMVYFTPDEFIAQGDRVVMLGRCAFRSRLTGITAETPKADFFRFRDGLIVEFFDFFDTATAYAASTPILDRN